LLHLPARRSLIDKGVLEPGACGSLPRALRWERKRGRLVSRVSRWCPPMRAACRPEMARCNIAHSGWSPGESLSEPALVLRGPLGACQIHLCETDGAGDSLAGNGLGEVNTAGCSRCSRGGRAGTTPFSLVCSLSTSRRGRCVYPEMKRLFSPCSICPPARVTRSHVGNSPGRSVSPVCIQQE
jgi:hypothetical protein